MKVKRTVRKKERVEGNKEGRAEERKEGSKVPLYI